MTFFIENGRNVQNRENSFRLQLMSKSLVKRHLIKRNHSTNLPSLESNPSTDEQWPINSEIHFAKVTRSKSQTRVHARAGAGSGRFSITKSRNDARDIPHVYTRTPTHTYTCVCGSVIQPRERRGRANARALKSWQNGKYKSSIVSCRSAARASEIRCWNIPHVCARVCVSMFVCICVQ